MGSKVTADDDCSHEIQRRLLLGRKAMINLLLLLLLSHFSRVRLCATLQTAAHQAPPSLGFSRQEHWSGLPFPSPMHESEKWKWSCSSRVWLLATPWTAAYQAPLSLGFSRQEYKAGCHDQPRQHIKKQRYNFADKGLPVVMYRCESWTIKKVEHWRIDAFELWCWRRLLRVPWTARRFDQSILKEISPKYSLEGLMLKLKLQYFGHLMWRTDSLEKTLMLEKLKAGEGDYREWDGWMASPTQWTWVWASSGSWWWTGKPGIL